MSGDLLGHLVVVAGEAHDDAWGAAHHLHVAGLNSDELRCGIRHCRDHPLRGDTGAHCSGSQRHAIRRHDASLPSEEGTGETRDRRSVVNVHQFASRVH